MPEQSSINSDVYWNQRFNDDWEICEGPRQSRFFARLAIENLPRWLIDQARRQCLMVADWGCAQGDGTDILASYIDSRQVVGIDFSKVAVEHATSRYPAIRFISTNWLGPATDELESYDIVFSSNALEHFHRPYDVLDALAERARKAVVLALPYCELERIDEHFYTFLPENVPIKLANGFRLVWSRVLDCSHLPDTLWNGSQIFLVYVEPTWLDSLNLTVADIGHDDIASEVARLNQAVVERDGEVARLNGEVARLNQAVVERDREVARLNQGVVKRDREVARLNQGVVERDGEVARLNQAVVERDGEVVRLNGEVVARLNGEVARLNQAVVERDGQIGSFLDSTSWRITRPVRLVKRLFLALSSALGVRLNGVRHHYASGDSGCKTDCSNQVEVDQLSCSEVPQAEDGASGDSGCKTDCSNQVEVDQLSCSDVPQAEDWLEAVAGAKKIAIIPCAFEFDDLVNQRPINAAKYYANEGYLVLFVAWQWSKDQVLERGCGRVWTNIYQVPLFYFIQHAPVIPKKQIDAIFLLTIPAKILVNFVPILRCRGYSIVYDIMDDWEEFHQSGQALWYDKELEEGLIIQSDMVCAVAPSLIEKFCCLRDDILLIGNGYTPDVLGNDLRGIAGSETEGRCVVGYFGHLTDAWFDWSLVFELADTNNDVQFEIIGYGEPEWVRARVRLSQNLTLVGKIHPKELHRYVKTWSFGIIPFKEGNLARAVDPIKIYEYLYFGLSTFVTGIEHLRNYPKVCFVSRAHAGREFKHFLARNDDDSLALDRFLDKTTWQARFSYLQSFVSQKKVLGDLYAP